MRQPTGFLIGPEKHFVSIEKKELLGSVHKRGGKMVPVWDHPPEMPIDLTWDEFEGMKVGHQINALESLV